MSTSPIRVRTCLSSLPTSFGMHTATPPTATPHRQSTMQRRDVQLEHRGIFQWHKVNIQFAFKPTKQIFDLNLQHMMEVDHKGQPSDYGFRPSLHHDVAITLSIEDFQGILSSWDPHGIQEALLPNGSMISMPQHATLWKHLDGSCPELAAKKHSTLHMDLGPLIWPSDSRIPTQESWVCVTLLQCLGKK